ncbi:MAG: LnmK family bifunctional acyltransferase/decarboxylase [Vicinamibacteria bacterium]
MTSQLRLAPRAAGPDRTWEPFELEVGMPHMAPGKLSEVELLKLLGAWQWDAIARALGRPAAQITSEAGERLYASFVALELWLPPAAGQDAFGEGDRVAGVNSIAFFANRFVEGLAVFGRGGAAAEAAARVAGRDQLNGLGLAAACLTNAFVARQGSNSRLKVLEPAGIAARSPARLDATPAGIAQHQQAQATGSIGGFGDAPGTPLVARRGEPILYTILPESDLNGAGLLYFPRYVAIMNYGERLLLSDRLERPLSSPLVACLSTERRRLFYFANAEPWDRVRVAISASLLPADAASPAPERVTPWRLSFRIDLYRESDKVLMASSLVRKALNVPPAEAGLLKEAERLRATLGPV